MSEQPIVDHAEETEDYPGLFVWDARCSGNITIEQTRLTLAAVLPGALLWGWDDAESRYPSMASMDEGEPFAGFLEYLLRARCEFARLLCVLADVERQAGVTDWRDDREAVSRVRNHLQRCLQSLCP
jgi:hypothetical protein